MCLFFTFYRCETGKNKRTYWIYTNMLKKEQTEFYSRVLILGGTKKKRIEREPLFNPVG